MVVMPMVPMTPMPMMARRDIEMDAGSPVIPVVAMVPVVAEVALRTVVRLLHRRRPHRDDTRARWGRLCGRYDRSEAQKHGCCDETSHCRRFSLV